MGCLHAPSPHPYMLSLLYFSLFLLVMLLCCNALMGVFLMMHTLRRWRSDESRQITEDTENITLMGSVRDSWR